jgi:ferredoxin
VAVWRKMQRGKLRQPGAAVQALTLPGGNSYLKYWLLAGSLAMAIGSLQLLGFFDPLVVFNRITAVAMSDAFAVGSTAFSLYLSFSGLALILVGLELWRPRFWCRHLCPQGALLAIFSPATVVNRRVSAACNNCSLCYRVCPMHAIPVDDFRGTNRGDCTLCLECEPVCPKKAITFGVGNLRREPTGPAAGIRRRSRGARRLGTQVQSLLSRRDFVGSVAVAGVALALPPVVKALPKRGVVRPPGALPEDEFVSTCIVCQECVRSCPTGGLQPAVLEAGLGAVGTPYLAPRKGGCLLNRSCPNVCASVCPVGAIQPVDPAKMQVGLAKVDRDRCLAWAQGVKCLVCVEACPTEAATPHQGRVFVNPAKCSGCGICEEACPVVDSAIHVTLEQETRFARGEAPPPKQFTSRS